MGWIKADLDETTHEAIRYIAENSDDPTHEIAARLLRKELEGTEAMIMAENSLHYVKEQEGKEEVLEYE